MQIDWFTLVAQIVNFIILLYLLRRFLYQPVVDVMDRREQKIASRLQEAEEKRASVEEQASRYEKKRQELEKERSERMEEIRSEVQEQRKKLMDTAQQEVREEKEDWQKALRQEQENFLQDLRREMGTRAVAIARRVLKDLADQHMEDRMAALFIEQLKSLDKDKKTAIAEAVRQSSEPFLIRSAHELPAKMRERLVEQTRNLLLDEEDHAARFETRPELISGIELQVNGYHVAWSLQGYLSRLEEEIRERIEEEAGGKEEKDPDDA